MKANNKNIIDKSLNIYNNNIKKEKDDKTISLNNKNNIKSINIINNNYNNIIINNKLTPNKKLILGDKTFSINKKNYKILTIGNKQKKLKAEILKLTMKNQNKDKESDNESKYKLIINEKNNLIKKLKNELEYYKNQNQANLNTNNNNTIPTKIIHNKELENIKNKIYTNFSQQKKEIQYDNNNLFNYNKNIYNNIKTNSNINFGTINNIIPMTEINLSNPINLNSIENSNSKYNKLMPNYSLKNDLKLKNKLTLDLNNYYNSIEFSSNRIYKNPLKSPKYLFTSNSINNNLKYKLDLNENNNINEYNAIINDERCVRKPSFNNLKKNKYFFNNILSTPFSLKKEIINKKIIDNHNLDSLTNNDLSNNISSTNFNDYKEKYENLKIRFNNLLENVFNLIENQNNQNEK